jgi:AcrR family transcriptional regulator
MARHGDLRNACVVRGLALLEKKGLAAVSLREIARRVGVSPRAPYRHFTDKSALLAAMAEEGFARFGAQLEGSRGRASSPRRRLEALGAAYIDFAVEHPHLVALMFGDVFPDRATRFPELHRAALSTFALLTDAVREALPARRTRPTQRTRSDAAMTAVSAWALVHGLADLLRHDQLAAVLPRVRRRDVERFAVQLLLRA